MVEDKRPQYEPITWSEGNMVMFLDGWAWANEFVEMEAKPPAVRCWDVRSICLGRKDDIIPILKGEKPILEDMSPRQIAVLEKILEVNGHGRELDTRAGGLERNRTVGVIRNRPKNARLSKGRKRVPRSKAHRQV